jgi:alkylated DNA repair dioxygenase AlkB
MDFGKKTITITFGDQAENHKGMQKIGEMAKNGFSLDDLKNAQQIFKTKGIKTQIVNLKKYLNDPASDQIEPAYLLIIRRGVDCLLEDEGVTTDQLFEELVDLEWDSKALMYGRVVNKTARHNLCFSEIEQKPDYENGMGRIIPYSNVPLLSSIRNNLSKYLKISADKTYNTSDLQAEGNYYYDDTCGIGFHGDSERKLVIGIRLGYSPPLHYQWYHMNEPVGSRAKIPLKHGDIYVMSEKAVGTDWKKKTIHTLRHATGSKRFTA